jgi:hypothetical protein
VQNIPPRFRQPLHYRKTPGNEIAFSAQTIASSAQSTEVADGGWGRRRYGYELSSFNSFLSQNINIMS